MLICAGRCGSLGADIAVVAGNIVFTAGVFTHSALRCHLTPQQQDKTDEERCANNRWRGQCRQILQQGALLPCRLTYRRLPPTVHCGVLPRMCSTQVLKMFVLLSYEVRSAVRSKAAIPLLLSGRPGVPDRGPRPARGRPAESAWLSWRATVLPGVPAVGTGDRTPAHHCVSPLLAAVRPPASWPASWPTAPFPGDGEPRLPAVFFPVHSALVPMISRVPHGHARDRGQRPVSPAARKVRGGGTAVGVTFRLMNGHRAAGSDRPPPAV